MKENPEPVCTLPAIRHELMGIAKKLMVEQANRACGKGDVDWSAPGAHMNSCTRQLKTFGEMNVSSVAAREQPIRHVRFMVSVINYGNKAKSLGKQAFRVSGTNPSSHNRHMPRACYCLSCVWPEGI